MKYKIGDEVIVKCNNTISCFNGLNDHMRELCNRKVKIESIVNNGYYHIFESEARWAWDDDCFIGKVGEIVLQPYIGVICENPEQINAVLKSLRHFTGNKEDAYNATEGAFIIDVDSYEFKVVDYRSDDYTFVYFSYMEKFHDEDELRKSNSCKYLYNELNHCSDNDVCKTCDL